jgi:AcrR family transcriptional regulator
MPRIWSETIAAHRDAVRDATLDATAALVAAHGLTGVTMSQIAKESGIGRATLYKYFPDVESVLAAWHERHIGRHLHHLTVVAEADGRASPGERLEVVLRAYANLSRQHRDGSDLAAVLHQGAHVARAHAHLSDFLTALVAAAAEQGDVRADIPAGELAAYCLHALTAAAGVPSQAALDRLVAVTLAGLRPLDPAAAG